MCWAQCWSGWHLEFWFFMEIGDDFVTVLVEGLQYQCSSFKWAESAQTEIIDPYGIRKNSVGSRPMVCAPKLALDGLFGIDIFVASRNALIGWPWSMLDILYVRVYQKETNTAMLTLHSPLLQTDYVWVVPITVKLVLRWTARRPEIPNIWRLSTLLFSSSANYPYCSSYCRIYRVDPKSSTFDVYPPYIYPP